MKTNIYITTEHDNSFIPSPVDGFSFSGGERNIKIEHYRESEPVDVFANIRSATDIIDLMLIKDALGNVPIRSLTIPYLPYARQDRVCNEGEAHGLRVMAKIINDFGASRVLSYDVHSYVAEGLINNFYSISIKDIFKTYIEDLNPTEYDVLVSPDAGAEKKVFQVGKEFGIRVETASKVRDLATGNIVATKFSPSVSLTNKKVLIVDDICDGGRTFVELAKAIHSKYDNVTIDLYTTHGIYSKGFHELEKYIDTLIRLTNKKHNPTVLEIERIKL